MSILLALDQGADDGWTDPMILGLFAVGGVLLAAFAANELRIGASALVPKAVMANRDFASACLAVLMMSAIFFAALLYLPQFMTHVLGFSPLRSGAGLLPMMGVFALTSFVAGPLYNKVGPKLIVSTGAALLAVGIFLLSFIEAGWSYGSLVPGMVVLGIGIGLFYSSVTTAGVTALDPSQSSLAGGIVYMCQIAGGAIGLGLNTAIVTGGSGSTEAIRLADGISTAFRVDAVLAVVGFVIALAFIGGTLDPERVRALRGHHRAHA